MSQKSDVTFKSAIFVAAISTAVMSEGVRAWAAPINIPAFVTATVMAPAAIPQGTSGQAMITVGLSMMAPAGSQVTTTMLNGTPMVAFVGGDNGDFISNLSVPTGNGMAGGNCFGGAGNTAVLNPGQVCNILVNFSGLDLRVPDPDVIAGIWTITTPFTVGQIGFPANTAVFSPSFTVSVTDPVPEPATSWLLLSGCVAVAGLMAWSKPDPVSKS